MGVLVFSSIQTLCMYVQCSLGVSPINYMYYMSIQAWCLLIKIPGQGFIMIPYHTLMFIHHIIPTLYYNTCIVNIKFCKVSTGHICIATTVKDMLYTIKEAKVLEIP